MHSFRPLLPLIAALLLASPLHAAGPKAADQLPYRLTGIVVAQRNCLTLGEAVEQVRRQYNGRIVSAETRRSGNREVHNIKVLTEDGKVKTVRINGCSVDRG